MSNPNHSETHGPFLRLFGRRGLDLAALMTVVGAMSLSLPAFSFSHSSLLIKRNFFGSSGVEYKFRSCFAKCIVLTKLATLKPVRHTSITDTRRQFGSW